MASLFTKIINGEIPCHKITESENCIAFLDIFPLKQGHTLVVPKKEVDYIFDLDDDLLQELHLFSKQVALAIEKTVPCARIGTAVIGLEVPHAHIHLIPINEVKDINFSQPKISFTEEEFQHTAEAISKNL